MYLLVLSILLLIASIAYTFWVSKQILPIQAEHNSLKTKLLPYEKIKKRFDYLSQNYNQLRSEYSLERAELLKNEEVFNQYNLGVGSVDNVFYQKAHEPEDLPKLEAELELAKTNSKTLVKSKLACVCNLGSDLVVNGRRSEAKKFVNREIKLRLRCFDNEVKFAKSVVDWNNINRLLSRVERVCHEINKRGEIVKTRIGRDYLTLRLKEIELTHQINQLKRDIKERELEERRIAREAEREEARIKAAADKAIAARERMEKLVQQELKKLESATTEQKELLEFHKRELELLREQETRAVSMAQQTRAGYVYIISNKMSFGDGVIKIGMTRRVDPYERVRELGDASVPDTFDVHAFFYCDDAPALEAELHKQFAANRINLVNMRKEFFMEDANNIIKQIETSDFEVIRTV